ncbi:MAG: hypothetical protein M3220_03240 [Chloroflexota bacterium]|nr:hypothetical protein [Chloroflexota bacterium]
MLFIRSKGSDSEQQLFCPRCGTANPADAEGCRQCGQDLRLVARALRQRNTQSTSHGFQWRGIASSIVVVLLLLAFMGAWQRYEQNQRRQQAEESRLQHYLSGVSAAEMERWDLAIEEFEAAGDYRDAPQRLEQARASFGRVQERYDEALDAWRAGRPWDAAFLLEQVVAALPDHRAAQHYLERAREQVGSIVVVRQTPNVPLEDASTVVMASATLGEQRVLASEVFEGADASFSPDGHWLVYEVLDEGQVALQLVEVTSGDPILLAGRAEDTWARWSPDSHYLLYGYEGEQGWSVFLRSLAEAHTRRLIDRADLATGDFSPQGGWITLWERRSNQWLFQVARTGVNEPPEVLVAQADSIGVQDWSEDEQRLAYGFLSNGRWQLYLTALPGGPTQEVAPGSDDGWLRFRPGTTHFVLWHAQEQSGTLTLWMDRQKTQALLQGAVNAWARWSADGRWLATSEWNGRTWQLKLFRMGESELPAVPITLASGVEEWDILFSPGSRYLLYRTFLDGLWSVTVRDLETEEEHLLLTDAVMAQGHWAPDGEHVLLWWVASPEPGKKPVVSSAGTLAVAEADTGQRLTLRQEVSAVQGAFSRDGSKMGLAVQPVSGSATVWVSNPDGSELLELDRDGYRIYWARMPFQFGPRAPRAIRP